MSIRAKFRVIEKNNRASYQKDGKPTCVVVLAAVYGDTPENKTWAAATPNGRVEMNIDNPAAYDAFELGKEYFLDFTPAGA